MSNQPIPPTPLPPAKAKSLFQSPKFWLILAGAAILASCLICAGIFSLGLIFREPVAAVDPIVITAPSPSSPASNNPSTPSATPAPDDFLYHAPNGDVFIPAITIAARGTAVTLAGTWREDHQGFLLQLNPDSTYRCEDGGSAGRNAVTNSETGTWSVQDNLLHLTPTALTLHAISGIRQITESHPPGPPYDLSIQGLTLQYIPYDNPNAPPKTLDGLLLQGKTPPWAYTPSGQWNLTLRRAP
jgi:hypothetical protein